MWWTGLCGLAPTTTFTSGIAVFSKGLENLNFIITLIHSLSFWLQSGNMNVQPYVSGLLDLLGGSERARERWYQGRFFFNCSAIPCLYRHRLQFSHFWNTLPKKFYYYLFILIFTEQFWVCYEWDQVLWHLRKYTRHLLYFFLTYHAI